MESKEFWESETFHKSNKKIFSVHLPREFAATSAEKVRKYETSSLQPLKTGLLLSYKNLKISSIPNFDIYSIYLSM